MPGFSTTLTPARARSSEARYAIVLGSATRLGDELGRITARIEDESRKLELAAVRNALTALQGDGLWLTIVGTVRVVKQQTGEHTKELDGIIACITDQQVQWWFLEHKSGAQGGAVGQLSELADFLRLECTLVESVQVVEGRAAWCSCSWPARIPSEA